jgi:hypothetical protein
MNVVCKSGRSDGNAAIFSRPPLGRSTHIAGLQAT